MTNSSRTKTAAENSSPKLTRTSSDGKWESFEKFTGLTADAYGVTRPTCAKVV